MTKDLSYEDPRLAEIYDLDNPWAEDTDFYLAQAEPGPAGVLDLGCGTGTLCCALAHRGHRVTGIDPAGQHRRNGRGVEAGSDHAWLDAEPQRARRADADREVTRCRADHRPVRPQLHGRSGCEVPADHDVVPPAARHLVVHLEPGAGR